MEGCICSEKETLRRIEEDIKSLLSVRIVSNKTHVVYSRDEFLQMLYDRPRETVRSHFNVLEKVTKVVSLLNLVILVYLSLVK